MTVDLDELRIDHSRTESSQGGSSRVWMVLFFVLLLGSGGAIGYLLKDRFGGAEREVRVELVRAPGPGSEGRNSFGAAGWVKLPRYHPVYVTPLTDGRVEEILVIEGDRVTAGQVIARLYAQDYEAQAAAAEAAWKAAEASRAKMQAGYRVQEVAEGRAEVARLEAELKVARQIFEHSREVQESGAISLEELQKDEARVATTRAQLTRASERLALLEEGYRAEEVALAVATAEKAAAELRLARQQLEYTEVHSPMDGVVLERLAARGQWLTPSAGVVVSLYDPADLEARIDVNQDDAARVFVGQEVEITTRAEPGTRHGGSVVLIEPRADLVKNTVPVRVKIEAPEQGLFHPDMVVQARFRARSDAPEGTAEVPRQAITVPTAAVRTDGDESTVFIVLDGLAHRRRVVLGPSLDGAREVVEGLRGGEQVVVGGLDGLEDGAPVRIVR